MDRPAAAEMLYSAEAAVRRTRVQRRAAWIPLAIFGVITLLASVLYQTQWSTTSPLADGRPLGFWNWLAGGSILLHPARVSKYWLVSLVLGYLVTVVLYRLRARQRGVATSAWPYALTGLGLFGLWIGFAYLTRSYPSGLFVRGLTPLIPMGLGLFALARVERSRALGWFAAAFLALAVVVNLYDIANVFSRVDMRLPTPQTGLIVPGVMLLLGAAGSWFKGRIRS